jgi:adenylate cyclase, class 2
MKKSTASRGPLEVEVKLAIRDVQQIRLRILKMGFRQETPRGLERNCVLDFDDQTLRKKGQLLRLREYQNKSTVTFKGATLKSKRYKVRLELETEVDNGEVLYRILEELGLNSRFRYEKYRTSFRPKKREASRSVLVTIDETPIGNYLEIEGKPELIRWVASQLGFCPNQYITKSYTELFFSSKLAKTRKNMVFARQRPGK